MWVRVRNGKEGMCVVPSGPLISIPESERLTCTDSGSVMGSRPIWAIPCRRRVVLKHLLSPSMGVTSRHGVFVNKIMNFLLKAEKSNKVVSNFTPQPFPY